MSEESKSMENASVRETQGRDEDVRKHEYARLVIHRLSRAIGHLEAVKKMAEEGRECTDILIQLAAVRGAINSISRMILKDHMERLMTDALESGNHDALEELKRAIDQMIQ